MTNEKDTWKGNYEEQHKIKEDLKDCTVCGCPITRKDYDDYKMCPWCYSQASLKADEGRLPLGYVVMYNEKRVEEILDTFTKVLSKADTFPSNSDPKEYKQFWTALRKEGANLLGVSRYLYGRVAKETATDEKEKA